MNHYVVVGIGGLLGSIARYALGAAVSRVSVGLRFPLGTLVVNVLGCFVMGVLTGLVEQRYLFSPSTRLFLLTGLMGGFTTFSAFGYETFLLGREHLWLAAISNVVLQVVVGIGALWLGHLLGTSSG